MKYIYVCVCVFSRISPKKKKEKENRPLWAFNNRQNFHKLKKKVNNW